MKTILIAGASGLVGSLLMQLAKEERTIEKIYDLNRKIDQIEGKIHRIKIDFDTPIKLPSNFTVDAVFLCLGTTIKKAGSQEAFKKVDYEYTIKIAELAKKHGASTCGLISSVGAGPSNFYLTTKYAVENAINDLGFEKTLIFRPGLLIGNRNESRFGEAIGQKLLGTWTQNFTSIFGKYTSIHASQLAKSMLKAMSDLDNGCHILHFNDMKKYF
jgi:nucleoside-diphosphate-sugar epimerase